VPHAVHHAIDVSATPEACWKVLGDLTTWPHWFPRLKWASTLNGDSDPWRIGGRFQIAFDFGIAVTVRTTVEELEPARKVRWVGTGFGITGNHSYTLHSHRPGLTRVTSHEEFTGLGARLMTARIRRMLDEEVHLSLERFRDLVETRH
jgi:hypothetical protein